MKAAVLTVLFIAGGLIGSNGNRADDLWLLALAVVAGLVWLAGRRTV